MSMDKFAKLYPDIVITEEQLTAGRFLESVGKIFLVDFGFGNCERMAHQIMEDQIAVLPKERRVPC